MYTVIFRQDHKFGKGKNLHVHVVESQVKQKEF